MTRSQFITRRNLGQLARDQRVRTVIFYFPGGHEWEEIFVDERDATIEQQEDDFRRKMGDTVIFVTPPRGESTPTTTVENWRA